MKIKFMSSEDSNGKVLMHSKSDNRELMIGNVMMKEKLMKKFSHLFFIFIE